LARKHASDEFNKLHCLIESLTKPIYELAARLPALEEFTKAPNIEHENSKVLGWLPKSQMPALQASYEDKVEVESSGSWILHHETFKYWRDAILPSGLWLCGELGTGKTILTMTVIKELKRLYGRTARGVFAYYYCSGTIAFQNTAKSLFKDILRQLVETGPGLDIFKTWYRNQADESSLTNNAMISLIQSLINGNTQDTGLNMAQTTIVIDALDEMEHQDQRTVLDKMKMLLQSSKGLLKVFISSRPIQMVEDRTTALDWGRIDVTRDITKNDINGWIDHEVDKGLSEKGRVGKTIRSSVKKTLKNLANGK
jgi:hypothetical protein